MQTLIQDLRYGLRILLKKPGFTLIVIITLMLGIGANTAIFSLINAVLLRPLPFPHPEQLFTLWERVPNDYEQNPPAAGSFVDWRDQNQVFASMANYAANRRFNLALEDRPERIVGAAVSASLFDVLGVSPAQGRVFLPEEEQPGRDQVVLLSHGFWKRRLAADSNVVGKTISLDAKSYTVIGVMPEGVQFPGGSGTVLGTFTAAPAEVWVPLALDANALNQRSAHYLNVIARLKPGITREQSGAEMDTLQGQLAQQYKDYYLGSHVKTVSLSEQVVGGNRRALLMLWGAVAFVLLIGCANVTNLLLSRAASRQKEIAVRAALGASRLRVIRQLLTESLVLALAGGIGGVLLATWSVDALSAILPANFPRRGEIAIDQWVLGFTFLISLLTGVIFGLAPALQSSRTNLVEALKEGGRSSSGSAHRNRVRNWLVITETALALVLLIGAALMIQSFIRLQRVNPGFRTDHLLTMELSLPSVRYPRPERAAFFQRLIERGKTLPGVRSIAASKQLPLSGDNMNFAFDVETRPFPPGKSPGADVRTVTSEYFETLGIPLVEGRVFRDSDGPEAPHVLVINEAMARRFFAGEDPIGQRMILGINNFTGAIVGVVGDVKHEGLNEEAHEEIYTPYSQAPFWTDMTLVMHTTGDPMTLIGAVRNEVAAVDKELPISKVRTMETIVADSVAQPRFRTLLLGLFGLVALILASVGIYGVMSYTVAQRTHEIGVRAALGAQPREVLKLIVGQGLMLALIGVGIGLVLAFWLTALMKDLLFGVKATDPATFGVIAALLIAVAFVACWVPARRATKVDPMVALRYE